MRKYTRQREREERSHKGNEEERIRETWRCSGNRKGGNREREREQKTRGAQGKNYVRKEEERPKTETLSRTIANKHTKKEKGMRQRL